MDLLQIIRKSKNFKSFVNKKKIKIVLISNISVHIFKNFIEYELKKSQINSEVKIANFDNLVQESENFKNYDVVILFFELLNFYHNVNNKKKKLSSNTLNRFQQDLKLCFKILKNTPLVLLNKFSNKIINEFRIIEKQKKIESKINKLIEKLASKNFHFLETSLILEKVGIKNSIDKNNFIKTRTLYSTKFMYEYAKLIKPSIMSLCGKQKKAIILDCDNTLWGGILGEDKKKIHIGSHSTKGKIFYEIQKILKDLKKRGLILCICSKNNFREVENLFKKNKMPLSFKDFTIKKINWNNKVDNIKDISKELNIGYESLLFIDDSAFEIGLIKKYLNKVDCFKVSENFKDYLLNIKILSNSFYFGSLTKEDELRSKSYEHEKKRSLAKKKHSNIDDYIKSLNIKVFYDQGKKISISRASQLCQRTNQFNLTTKRYDEKQIKKMSKDRKFFISTISVKDDYGEYGITGLAIVKLNYQSKSAEIDTFLMSCRIIGRGIEKTFMNWIIKKIKKKNFYNLRSYYKKTEKNILVKNFYEQNNFKIISNLKIQKNYQLKL
jgi:FkbH-like protein